MSDVIVLTSPDDHQFDVYEAQPDGGAKGTIVVIQEIFGVNAHIREVAQGFASMGYRALAPALFDRVERQVSLGYSGADMMQGVELARGKLQREDALMDLQTTIAAAAMTGPVGVAIVLAVCSPGLPPAN
jgi:carboxymethylenebutenolidase